MGSCRISDSLVLPIGALPISIFQFQFPIAISLFLTIANMNYNYFNGKPKKS